MTLVFAQEGGPVVPVLELELFDMAKGFIVSVALPKSIATLFPIGDNLVITVQREDG